MIVKAAVASLILASTYSIAAADSSAGKILAFDRQAKIIVLKDKTVWTLEGSDAAVPSDLKSGDTVQIEFTAEGEDGITQIDAIKVTPE